MGRRKDSPASAPDGIRARQTGEHAAGGQSGKDAVEGVQSISPLPASHKNGDVRSDGFVFRSGAWRSPQSILNHNNRRRAARKWAIRPITSLLFPRRAEGESRGRGYCEHGIWKHDCAACCPHRVLLRYVKGAKERGLEWALTDSQVFHLLRSACAYCGTQGVVGIDRVKNEYGYNVLNVVPCCANCNYLKRNFDVRAWIEAVCAITRHSKNYEVFKEKRWLPMREELQRLGVK